MKNILHIEDQEMQGIEQAKAGIYMFGTYIVSGGIMIGGVYFKFEHIGLGCGLALGLATFFMNWYYKHKDSKRKDKGS